MNLSNFDAWAKLTRFLTTNPEIVSLKIVIMNLPDVTFPVGIGTTIMT